MRKFAWLPRRVSSGQVAWLSWYWEYRSLYDESTGRRRGSSELTPRRLNSKGTTGRANPYVRKTSRHYNKKQTA
jgi:hypothetical protein